MTQNYLSSLDDFISGAPSADHAKPIAVPHDDSGGADDFIFPAEALLKASITAAPAVSAKTQAVSTLDKLSPPSSGHSIEGSQSFAQAGVEHAASYLVVVSTDEHGQVQAAAMAALKAEVLPWLDIERQDPANMTALGSPIARDVCAGQIAAQYAQAALSTPDRCFLAPLPTGRWVALVPEYKLAQLSVERVISQAHRQAIEQAKAQGLPHNEDALRGYLQQQNHPAFV